MTSHFVMVLGRFMTSLLDICGVSIPCFLHECDVITRVPADLWRHVWILWCHYLFFHEVCDVTLVEDPQNSDVILEERVSHTRTKKKLTFEILKKREKERRWNNFLSLLGLKCTRDVYEYVMKDPPPFFPPSLPLPFPPPPSLSLAKKRRKKLIQSIYNFICLKKCVNDSIPLE